MLAHYLGLGARRTEESGESLWPVSLEERVQGLISRINYGDEETAIQASRSLLSMGPGILPIVFARLLSLEHNPRALSPRCQLALEEILGDFGLRTYLLLALEMGSVHRASPVSPAILRVLTAIGPHTVTEMSRVPALDPAGAVAPLMWRFGAPGCAHLQEVLSSRAEDIPDGLISATLPTLADDAELFSGMVARCEGDGLLKLIQGLAPWLYDRAVFEAIVEKGEDEAAAIALTEIAVRTCKDPGGRQGALMALVKQSAGAGAPSREVVTSLLGALPLEALMGADDESLLTDLLGEKEASGLRTFFDGWQSDDDRRIVERALVLVDDPALKRVGVRVLGACMDDPRAVERLVSLAGDPAEPCGTLALLALARAGLGPLEALMAARVRGAWDRGSEVLSLRFAAALAAQEVQGILLRLLRAESQRVASLAARLLAPLDPPLESLFKALGRHRHSAIEPSIAPLIWARWPEVRGWLALGLASEDREVCQAAVDMAGVLGEPRFGEPLLKLMERDEDFVEPALNALELIGAEAAPLLRRFSEQRPELARSFDAGRRLKLMETMASKVKPRE